MGTDGTTKSQPLAFVRNQMLSAYCLPENWEVGSLKSEGRLFTSQTLIGHLLYSEPCVGK